MKMTAVSNDYMQGVQAANRSRIRNLINSEDIPETPINVVDCIEFLRGVFEGGGAFDESAVSMFNVPGVDTMLNKLDIQFNIEDNMIMIRHANAHDFLGRIYDHLKPTGTTKHEQYINHIGGLVNCKVWKTDVNAVVPYKNRPSDIGYDLVLIKKVKQLTPMTALFDTGIKVSVELGHYIEIVPRSSISKTGYILANSTGIIDPGYTGNLFVALTKIDPSMPDIELPFRGCQLIIRRQVHGQFEVMESIDSLVETGRSAGGFGSTGK